MRSGPGQPGGDPRRPDASRHRKQDRYTPKKEGVTRKAFLEHLRSLFGMSVAAGILGTAIYKNHSDDVEQQKALESRISPALRRRQHKFAEQSHAPFSLPPLQALEPTGSSVEIDLESIGLDTMEWGGASGMYFNGSNEAAKRLRVDFIKAQQRVHFAKTERLNQSLFTLHREAYRDILSALKNSAHQKLVSRLEFNRTLKLKQLLAESENDDSVTVRNEHTAYKLLTADQKSAYIAYMRAACEAAVSELPLEQKNALVMQLQTADTATLRYAHIAAMSETLSREYAELYEKGEHGPASLSQVTSDVASISRTLNSAIDWQAFGKQLTPEELVALEHTAKLINGDVLIASSMTELLPHTDGAINYKLYNQLCLHAGKEFLARLPALGDDLLSFGPWQLTRYAINDPSDEDRDKSDSLVAKMGGATQLTAHLPHGHRPAPLLEEVVTFDEHASTTYLNAVFNVRAIISKLNPKELQGIMALTPRDVALIVNLAHHKPRVAGSALQAYLRALRVEAKPHTTTDTAKQVVTPMFIHFVPEELQLYVRKTAANYDAIVKAQS